MRFRSLSPMLDFSVYTTRGDLYTLPKLKNMTFQAPKDPSSTDETKTLQSRIQSLEKQLQCEKSRGDSLEAINKELTSELEGLRKQSYQEGDMQLLYQDLFITDMKQQIEELSREAETNRMLRQEAKLETESLRKVNFQLQATVKRYRNMLNSSIKKPQDDTSTITSGMFSESDRSPRKSRSSVTGSITKQVSLKKVGKIQKILKEIALSKNLMDLCKATTTGMKTLTKCEKATIFIVNPQAQSLYVESFKQSTDFIGKIRQGSTWIYIHTHEDASQEEPLFSKVEDIKNGIREPDKLVCPVQQENKTLLVLQCRRKLSKRKKQTLFSTLDETFLRILSSVASLSIKSIVNESVSMKEVEHGKKVIQLANNLVSARSYQDIANRVKDQLPRYLDFESAGLVFYDQFSQDLFAMIPDPQGDEYYSENVQRFTKNMGVTSQVFHRSQPVVVSNPKMFPFYNPEIDNVGATLEVKNIYIVPVYDWHQKLVGILQLTNHAAGDIHEKHLNKLKPLLAMIGGALAAASLNIEQTTMIIQAKDSMKGLVEALKLTEECSGTFETSEISKVVIRLNAEMTKLQKTHKKLFNVFR